MSDKKHIFFVDDEQNVLDGLRRMLRSMRSEWDMAFVSGGEEALLLLEKQRCDVIVSDLRMPGMSGEQLLAEVRKRYPAMVRLVLSGQADKDSIIKSIGPVHQFLQKPCDEDMLKSTITRTIEMGDLFTDESLKSMVAELESLPSLPAHQQDLIEQLQMDDIPPKLIGESIGRDVAMTAKILQLVNSAFFGLGRHVGSPVDAVKLLGMDTVRPLVMTMQVFSQVSQDEVKGFSHASLFSHSAEVATIAKKIALAEGMPSIEAENAFMAGLLHDVGKLILATKRPKEYAEALALASSQQIPVEEAERKVIGASHCETGAYLLGLWAFESSIVDAVLYHHCPNRYPCSRFTVSTAVHVANEIVNRDPDAIDTDGIHVDQEYLDRIGLGDRLTAWWSTCQNAA